MHIVQRVKRRKNKMTKIYSAVNWNNQEDDFSLMFWQQNVSQFWIDTEIPLSSDKMVWAEMETSQQETYKRVLGGLTLLDTVQGTIGMPKIAEMVDNLHRKAVLSFMGMMENIHAKSYSSIFSTLATTEEINEIFEWVEENKYLQYKAKVVESYYKDVKTNKDLYMAMVASVFLETFLFYSGFFYPLYLAGQGKMTSSGEIINLIIRDESIHGVFVGLLAQELYKDLSATEKKQVNKEIEELLEDLYKNELLYTEEVYHVIGLEDEVKKFLRYNANKAMMNLGKEPFFPDEEINPIVLNGMKTDTKTHDFFSLKGSSYVKATNVEKMTDEDFEFDI
jgi:ribonucleoside-diphosphate reductase beta chain